MDIINIRYNIPFLVNEDCVLVVGNFEAIHVAHRELIRKARRVAKDKNLALAVMLFDVTPRKVINDIDNYYLLRSFKQREAILKKLDVDKIFIVNFDDNFKEISASSFIEDIIIKTNAKYVLCGFDFHFGKNREGSPYLLQEYKQFKTIILPSQLINEHKVGSTYIHELIMHGRIERANHLLVDPYSLVGTVVYGNQRGNKIGFPTANLLPVVNYRILKNGVYATKVIYNDKIYLGMTNIGHNPTINYSTSTVIETNIINFDENIYGAEIEVIFYKFIRNEKIFPNVKSLIKQIEADKVAIIRFFEQDF